MLGTIYLITKRLYNIFSGNNNLDLVQEYHTRECISLEGLCELFAAEEKAAE